MSTRLEGSRTPAATIHFLFLIGQQGVRFLATTGRRDVLRIDGGGVTGKKVKAPVPNGWVGSPSIDSAAFMAHSKFGFMCTVLKPDLDTP